MLSKKNRADKKAVERIFAKLATRRNVLRRRGYAVLEKYITQFPPGLIGVFIFKKPEAGVSIIEHEIKNILAKIS